MKSTASMRIDEEGKGNLIEEKERGKARMNKHERMTRLVCKG